MPFSFSPYLLFVLYGIKPSCSFYKCKICFPSLSSFTIFTIIQLFQYFALLLDKLTQSGILYSFDDEKEDVDVNRKKRKLMTQKKFFVFMSSLGAHQHAHHIEFIKPTNGHELNSPFNVAMFMNSVLD